MKKLKIGFVIDDSIDRPDGVQQYLYSLSDYFRQKSHQVYFLSGQSSGRVDDSFSLATNLKVRFNRNILSIPIYANKIKIKKTLAELELDILHFQLPFSPILSRQIIKLSPHTAKVATFHIYSERKLEIIGSKLLNLTIQQSLKQLDLIYALSGPAQQFALDNFKIKSQIKPVPINLTKFKFQPIKTQSLVKIVFLGRLVKRKNCQLFLQAFHQLVISQSNLNFQAIIIGDGPLRTSLEKLTASYNLTSQVEFVGFVDELTKFKLLRQADLAVFPSLGSESFGIVLLEALAAKHPIVLASNNPGYSFVLKSLTDNLFDPTNANQLAAKMVKLLIDGQLVQRTLNKQLQLIKHFDIQIIGDEILDDYNKILRKSLKS